VEKTFFVVRICRSSPARVAGYGFLKVIIASTRRITIEMVAGLPFNSLPSGRRAHPAVHPKTTRQESIIWSNQPHEPRNILGGPSPPKKGYRQQADCGNHPAP